MTLKRITAMSIALLSLSSARVLSAQPRLPDLTVVSTRVERGKVVAVVANRGAVAPAIRATTTLFVNEPGQRPRTAEAVTPALLPRSTAELSFDTVLLPGATYQVMIDSGRAVDESDETNNRTRNETVPGGPPPRTRASPAATSCRSSRTSCCSPPPTSRPPTSSRRATAGRSCAASTRRPVPASAPRSSSA
jgi:hypothetical protein